MTSRRNGIESTTERTELSRLKTVQSYQVQLDRMFGNIRKDLETGIRISKVFSMTGKLCQSDDEADGRCITEMLEALRQTMEKVDDLCQERLGTMTVTDEEWGRLDATAGGVE